MKYRIITVGKSGKRNTEYCSTVCITNSLSVKCYDKLPKSVMVAISDGF